MKEKKYYPNWISLPEKKAFRDYYLIEWGKGYRFSGEINLIDGHKIPLCNRGPGMFIKPKNKEDLIEFSEKNGFVMSRSAMVSLCCDLDAGAEDLVDE